MRTSGELIQGQISMPAYCAKYIKRTRRLTTNQKYGLERPDKNNNNVLVQGINNLF